jgi:16S rRNA C1402 (ribose-2'-O) methylase RsmI
MFEEIVRGTIADVITLFEGKTVKGEITILVSGSTYPGNPASLTVPAKCDTRAGRAKKSYGKN